MYMERLLALYLLTKKFLLTIKEARENGLDSLAITEHLGSNNFLEGYEFLKTYPRLLWYWWF